MEPATGYMNHSEAISMQRRMQDWIDNPSHSQARELEKLFQRLEDDVQVGKSSHTIIDDLKRIESLCRSIDSEAMSHGHSSELEQWARNSIQKIR